MYLKQALQTELDFSLFFVLFFFNFEYNLEDAASHFNIALMMVLL